MRRRLVLLHAVACGCTLLGCELMSLHGGRGDVSPDKLASYAVDCHEFETDAVLYAVLAAAGDWVLTEVRAYWPPTYETRRNLCGGLAESHRRIGRDHGRPDLELRGDSYRVTLDIPDSGNHGYREGLIGVHLRGDGRGLAHETVHLACARFAVPPPVRCEAVDHPGGYYLDGRRLP